MAEFANKKKSRKGESGSFSMEGIKYRGWEEKGRFVPSHGGEEAKVLQRRMGIRPLVKSV